MSARKRKKCIAAERAIICIVIAIIITIIVFLNKNIDAFFHQFFFVYFTVLNMLLFSLFFFLLLFLLHTHMYIKLIHTYIYKQAEKNNKNLTIRFNTISANKKAKLINGTSSVQQQSYNGAGSASSVISSDEYQIYQTNNSQLESTALETGVQGSAAGRLVGPHLVNKQLVLPFVPPSFPNGSSDGSNHLIKPSEYLKSISDKRSSGSSGRYVINNKK